MSRFLLPYNFKGFLLDKAKIAYQGKKLSPRHTSHFYLGEGIYSQFSTIYTDVLQAIAENDQEYLEGIMEPRLFQRTKKGIEEILGQGYRIQYIANEDSNPGEELFDEHAEHEQFEQGKQMGILNFKVSQPKDLFQYKENDMKIYFQPYAIFGVNIHRHLNNDRKYLELRSRYSERSYYFNSKDIFQVLRKQILQLNVYYRTNRQLQVIDEDGDIVEGNEHLTDKLIRHKWQFESYSKNLDWVITDMDEALGQNPFIKKQEQQQE